MAILGSIPDTRIIFIIEVENRKGLYDYLRLNNIFCQVHYIPVHTMPYYKSIGYKKGSMPLAEKYYENCFNSIGKQ